MNNKQQLFYLNENYKIISAEQEFLIHPAAFGLLMLSSVSLQTSFTSSFCIEDFRLILNQLTMNYDGIETHYAYQDFIVTYTGAVLIGANQVKDYNVKDDKLTCFSYKSVFELVFEDGILITTIDQSKAMSRIRKNIELGFRSLTKSRDIRCIKRFINASLIGDYRTFLFGNSRFKYIKEMKKGYPSTYLMKQISSVE